MKDFKVNNFIESVFNSLSWASKIDVRGAFSSLSKKVSRIFSFNLRKSDDPNTHLPLKSKRVSTNPSSKFTIRSMWSRINVQSPSLQKLPLKDEIELTNLPTFEEKLESLRQIKEAMLTAPMANFDGQKYVHASSFEMSLSRLFEDLVRLTADSFLVEKTQNGDFSLDCFRKILNISGEQGTLNLRTVPLIRLLENAIYTQEELKAHFGEIIQSYKEITQASSNIFLAVEATLFVDFYPIFIKKIHQWKTEFQAVSSKDEYKLFLLARFCNLDESEFPDCVFPALVKYREGLPENLPKLFLDFQKGTSKISLEMASKFNRLKSVIFSDWNCRFARFDFNFDCIYQKFLDEIFSNFLIETLKSYPIEVLLDIARGLNFSPEKMGKETLIMTIAACIQSEIIQMMIVHDLFAKYKDSFPSLEACNQAFKAAIQKWNKFESNPEDLEKEISTFL